MGQAFDSLFQLDEGAKVSKLCDLALYDVVHMVLFFKVNPRIFGKVLERKIDALFFGIKADNLKLDFLAFLYKVFGASHVAPAHVVDVKEAVKAAQIDEGAKACEALDDALYAVADLSLGEELVASGVQLLLKVAAAVNDHVGLVVRVEALNIKFALCSKQAFGLFNLLAVGLADRKEGANVAAKSDFKTALDNLVDCSVNNSLFVKRLANVFPHLLGVGFCFRNFRTVSTVFSKKNYCYKIPGLGQVAREF